jgi:hypothetical protein
MFLPRDALKNSRPMRPKPFIPTRIAMISPARWAAVLDAQHAPCFQFLLYRSIIRSSIGLVAAQLQSGTRHPVAN